MSTPAECTWAYLILQDGVDDPIQLCELLLAPRQTATHLDTVVSLCSPVPLANPANSDGTLSVGSSDAVAAVVHALTYMLQRRSCDATQRGTHVGPCGPSTASSERLLTGPLRVQNRCTWHDGRLRNRPLRRHRPAGQAGPQQGQQRPWLGLRRPHSCRPLRTRGQLQASGPRPQSQHAAGTAQL